MLHLKFLINFFILLGFLSLPIELFQMLRLKQSTLITFFGPVYDEDCVENQMNDESAPLCPPGSGYGAGSGNTFSYKLPGSTALCGSEGPPLIHMIPGKIYKLVLINNTKSPTNLHTHGLHIDGNWYSDDFFRQVRPGMCLEYIWDIVEACSCGTCVSLCFR